jgi:cytochrome c oxidase subunit I+III
LFPIFAGLYYFYPILTDRLLSERLGRIAFWLAFVGFNVAFLPMHLTGLRGMPRRVFTYEANLGFDELNLVSTIGAFILAAGIAVICVDVLRPRRTSAYPPRNPWNAGTLEWVQEMPGRPWGIRSIPQIESRYPLWDQPNLLRDIDEGRFYLPDAEEGRRETIVTTVIDAVPVQCQRLPGPSFVPLIGALTLGGFFIFGTYHRWLLAVVSLVVAIAVIWHWLWTATAQHPEKERKDVGLGVSLPLYVSGSGSVSWWAVFITMLADTTAFVCLVFGYFFFWTIHDDFPPSAGEGPLVEWIVAGAVLLLTAWALTFAARRTNRADRASGTYAALAVAVVCAAAGGAALLAGPWLAGLDPTAHSYPAIVWLLLAWNALHSVVGIIMLSFCIIARARGRLTARRDLDLHNVTLYWHFVALMVAITALVVAGFPRVA